MPPSLPKEDALHALHDYGWLAPWTVVEHNAPTAIIEHAHPGGDWPWDYRARQRFEVSDTAMTLSMTLENRGVTAMPTSLGFHRFFPCSPDTELRALHRGEWQSGADAFPVSLIEASEPRDWWAGQPVASRAVDTVYTGRVGALTVHWPDRSLEAQISCSPLLSGTAIYMPAGTGWFCAEPVSHATNAINGDWQALGLIRLEPGGVLEAWMTISVRRMRACEAAHG